MDDKIQNNKAIEILRYQSSLLKHNIQKICGEVNIQTESIKDTISALVEMVTRLEYRLKNYENKQTVSSKFISKKKIRIGFIVTWSSEFSSNYLYKLFKASQRFETTIIVNKIPEIKNNPKETFRFNDVYDKSLKEIHQKYGTDNVITNYQNLEYIDLTGNYDILIYNTICRWYYTKTLSLPYVIEKGILSVYIPYGITVSNSALECMKQGIFGYSDISGLFRFYVDSSFLYNELRPYFSLVRDCGYAKLDGYFYTKYIKKGYKKTILLCPHQDFIYNCFCGNFLETYSLYIDIPTKYPNINFVFRPHPLWKNNLILCWGKNKTEHYIKKLFSIQNIFYSDEDDYYSTFKKADAMIHDCATFLVEFLYTEKPALFLQDSKNIQEKYLNKFGQECLHYQYTGHTLSEVCFFIDSVVLKNNDTKREKRMSFAKQLKVSNKGSSKKIFEDIIKSIN